MSKICLMYFKINKYILCLTGLLLFAGVPIILTPLIVITITSGYTFVGWNTFPAKAFTSAPVYIKTWICSSCIFSGITICLHGSDPTSDFPRTSPHQFQSHNRKLHPYLFPIAIYLMVFSFFWFLHPQFRSVLFPHVRFKFLVFDPEPVLTAL